MGQVINTQIKPNKPTHSISELLCLIKLDQGQDQYIINTHQNSDAQSIQIDQSSNIDYFEYYSLQLVLNDCTLQEKVQALFLLFNVSQNQKMIFDELVLLLQSCLRGICKFNSQTIPDYKFIYQYSQQMFRQMGKQTDSFITEAEILDYAQSSKEILQFFNNFTDVQESPKKTLSPQKQQSFTFQTKK